MKNTVILAALLSALVMLGLQYGVLDAPSAPEPIEVQELTEAQIKQEMKIERKEKQYRNAEKVAASVYRRLGCKATYAGATGRVAIDVGISPRLLAGLVFVESSCRTDAVSGKDSVGLTQVNPRIWKYKKTDLRDPEKNLRIGATILASYIRKYGVVEGLHHYNGYSDVHGHEYVNKVLAAGGLHG